MKSADWRKLVRPLLPQDREWAESGFAVYAMPCQWVALGVAGQTSRWDSKMRVHRLVMPLVPTTPAWVLPFGHSRSPFLSEGDLSSEIENQLRDLPAESDAIAEIGAIVPEDSAMAERVGYLRFIAGDIDGARAALDQSSDPDRSLDSDLRRVARVTEFVALLDSRDLAGAHQLLDTWADETAALLKVTRPAHRGWSGP